MPKATRSTMTPDERELAKLQREIADLRAKLNNSGDADRRSAIRSQLERLEREERFLIRRVEDQAERQAKFRAGGGRGGLPAGDTLLPPVGYNPVVFPENRGERLASEAAGALGEYDEGGAIDVDGEGGGEPLVGAAAPAPELGGGLLAAGFGGGAAELGVLPLAPPAAPAADNNVIHVAHGADGRPIHSIYNITPGQRLGLAVADNIHDAWGGFRNKADAEGDHIRNACMQAFSAGNACLTPEITKCLTSRMSNNVLLSIIEDSTVDYFERNTKGFLQAPSPLAVKKYSDVIADPIGTANAVRRDYDTFRIVVGDGGDIAAALVNKTLVTQFILQFLLGVTEADIQMTFDAAPKIVGKFFAKHEHVSGLIMPQNIGDSASTSHLQLGKEKNTYYFPSNGDESGKKVFVSTNNALSKDYLTAYYKDDGFVDKCYDNFYFGLKSNSDPTQRAEKSYAEGFTQGPSLDYLLELLLLSQKNGDLSTVIPSVSCLQVGEAIQRSPSIRDLIINNAGGVFLDLKREGDQDAVSAALQVLLDYIRDDKYVIFCTIDRLCALWARLLGIPCIWHFGDEITLYKNIQNDRTIDPVAKERYMQEQNTKFVTAYKPIWDTFSDSGAGPRRLNTFMNTLKTYIDSIAGSNMPLLYNRLVDIWNQVDMFKRRWVTFVSDGLYVDADTIDTKKAKIDRLLDHFSQPLTLAEQEALETSDKIRTIIADVEGGGVPIEEDHGEAAVISVEQEGDADMEPPPAEVVDAQAMVQSLVDAINIQEEAWRAVTTADNAASVAEISHTREKANHKWYLNHLPLLESYLAPGASMKGHRAHTQEQRARDVALSEGRVTAAAAAAATAHDLARTALETAIAATRGSLAGNAEARGRDVERARLVYDEAFSAASAAVSAARKAKAPQAPPPIEITAPLERAIGAARYAEYAAKRLSNLSPEFIKVIALSILNPRTGTSKKESVPTYRFDTHFILGINEILDKEFNVNTTYSFLNFSKKQYDALLTQYTITKALFSSTQPLREPIDYESKLNVNSGFNVKLEEFTSTFFDKNHALIAYNAYQFAPISSAAISEDMIRAAQAAVAEHDALIRKKKTNGAVSVAIERAIKEYALPAARLLRYAIKSKRSMNGARLEPVLVTPVVQVGGAYSQDYMDMFVELCDKAGRFINTRLGHLYPKLIDKYALTRIINSLSNFLSGGNSIKRARVVKESIEFAISRFADNQPINARLRRELERISAAAPGDALVRTVNNSITNIESLIGALIAGDRIEDRINRDRIVNEIDSTEAASILEDLWVQWDTIPDAARDATFNAVSIFLNPYKDDATFIAYKNALMVLRDSEEVRAFEGMLEADKQKDVPNTGRVYIYNLLVLTLIDDILKRNIGSRSSFLVSSFSGSAKIAAGGSRILNGGTQIAMPLGGDISPSTDARMRFTDGGVITFPVTKEGIAVLKGWVVKLAGGVDRPISEDMSITIPAGGSLTLPNEAETNVVAGGVVRLSPGASVTILSPGTVTFGTAGTVLNPITIPPSVQEIQDNVTGWEKIPGILKNILFQIHKDTLSREVFRLVFGGGARRTRRRKQRRLRKTKRRM